MPLPFYFHRMSPRNYTFFFESAGELRIIILSRRKRGSKIDHITKDLPRGDKKPKKKEEKKQKQTVPDKQNQPISDKTRQLGAPDGCGKKGETLSSCHFPQLLFLPCLTKSCRNTRGDSIKDNSIPMIPNNPSSQGNKGVDTLHKHISRAIVNHLPPTRKRHRTRCRSQIL
jgi:hypothetical protein